jgi:putative membrane protein
MIDYLAVMLVTVGIGLALLAFYLYFAPDESKRQTWGGGFLTVGLVLFFLALNIDLHWILPSSYNIAFGEPALLFAAIYGVTGILLLLKQDILGPSIVGFFAGIVPIVVGLRMMNMGMTSEPGLSGTGYILAGLGGMLNLPAIGYKNQRAVAILAAIVLIVGAVIFAYMGYGAFWSHLAAFAKYAPK